MGRQRIEAPPPVRDRRPSLPPPQAATQRPPPHCNYVQARVCLTSGGLLSQWPSTTQTFLAIASSSGAHWTAGASADGGLEEEGRAASGRVSDIKHTGEGRAREGGSRFFFVKCARPQTHNADVGVRFFFVLPPSPPRRFPLCFTHKTPHSSPVTPPPCVAPSMRLARGPCAPHRRGRWRRQQQKGERGLDAVSASITTLAEGLRGSGDRIEAESACGEDGRSVRGGRGGRRRHPPLARWPTNFPASRLGVPACVPAQNTHHTHSHHHSHTAAALPALLATRHPFPAPSPPLPPPPRPPPSPTSPPLPPTTTPSRTR